MARRTSATRGKRGSTSAGSSSAVPSVRSAADAPVRSAARRASADSVQSTQSSEPDESKRTGKRASPRAWTSQEKLNAVVAMLHAGREHPLSEDGLNAARAVLNADVATGTLARWHDELHDEARAIVPKPTVSIEHAQQAALDGKQAVTSKWQRVEDLALDELTSTDKMRSAMPRDLAVVGGIARTHLNKLSGVRPELEVAMLRYDALCARANLDPVQALDDIMAAIEAHLPRLANVVPALARGEDKALGDKGE